MAKKKAMVAPPPIKPDQVETVGYFLSSVLQQLGNNRAYTIIRSHNNSWRVHFEGDYKPSTVALVNGKWTITLDK